MGRLPFLRARAFPGLETVPQAALFHKKRAIALIDVLGAPEAQSRGRAIDLPSGSLQFQEQADRRLVDLKLEISYSGQPVGGAELLVTETGPKTKTFYNSA